MLISGCRLRWHKGRGCPRNKRNQSSLAQPSSPALNPRGIRLSARLETSQEKPTSVVLLVAAFMLFIFLGVSQVYLFPRDIGYAVWTDGDGFTLGVNLQDRESPVVLLFWRVVFVAAAVSPD
ncbi:hypothetical protein C8R45DRAFT_1076669 [Mycena sanguinolenta]|nr:hypothetical protein C8R45DRAFT_1076669 [Mycena sanguinolenta]